MTLASAPPVRALPGADTYFESALDALVRGDLELALGLIRAALRENVQKGDYHELHAIILLAMPGDTRPAMKAMEMALRLQPERVSLMIHLAQLYRAHQMPVRAETLLSRARRIDPYHAFFRQEARQKAPASPVPEPEGRFRALIRRLRGPR